MLAARFPERHAGRLDGFILLAQEPGRRRDGDLRIRYRALRHDAPVTVIGVLRDGVLHPPEPGFWPVAVGDRPAIAMMSDARSIWLSRWTMLGWAVGAAVLVLAGLAMRRGGRTAGLWLALGSLPVLALAAWAVALGGSGMVAGLVGPEGMMAASRITPGGASAIRLTALGGGLALLAAVLLLVLRRAGRAAASQPP